MSTPSPQQSSGRPPHRIGVYWTLGDQGLDTSKRVVTALIDSGVTLLELGLPFSDPLLDGPLIQGSHHAALQAGVSFEESLQLLRDVVSLAHEKGVLVSLMTASQLVYTAERRKLLPALDGLLVTDISSQKISPFPLPSPRVWFVSQEVVLSSGFSGAPPEEMGMVYLTRLKGLTGEGQAASESTQKAIARVRAECKKDLWLGFGVSTPEDVAQGIADGADGVIVGSAFVQKIHRSLSEGIHLEEEIARWVSHMQSHVLKGDHS